MKLKVLYILAFLVSGIFLGLQVAVQASIEEEKLLIIPRQVSEATVEQAVDFLAAELALGRGDVSGASKSLSSYLKRGTSVAARKMSIRLLAKQGRYADILSIKNEFKDDIEMQLIYAEAYLNANNEKDAQRFLYRLAQRHPSHEKVAYLAAVISAKSGEFDKALKVLDAFLRESAERTRHFLFHFLQSKVYLLQEDFAKSKEAIEKSLKLYPQFSKGWLLQSLIAKQEGRVKDAIAGLKRFSELEGMEPDIQRELVSLLLDAERYGEAKDELLKLNDDSAEFYFDLGLIDMKRQKFAESLKNIDHAIEKDPAFDPARLMKAELLYQLGRFDDVLSYMSKWMLEVQPSVLPLQVLSVLLQDAAISRRKVKKFLSRMLKKNPQNKQLLAMMVDFSIEQGSHKNALPLLERLLGLTTHSERRKQILYYIAHTHTTLGNIDRAIDLLKPLTIAQERDAHPEACNLLAYCYALKNEQLPAALELVDRALKQSPTSSSYLDTKGLVLIKLGKRSLAKEVLEQAQGIDPKDTYISHHLKEVA